MAADSTAADELRELLARTVAVLDERGAHDEALGVPKPTRKLFGLASAEVLLPAGRAWRLGALLLDREGHLYATGKVTRAIEPGRAAVNRSAAGERRRAERMAASRGPFPRGEVINHAFTPIALDLDALRAGSGPLSIRDGVVMVRFDPNSGDLGVAPLESYLADRLAALLDS